jgi:hypothetical protein
VQSSSSDFFWVQMKSLRGERRRTGKCNARIFLGKRVFIQFAFEKDSQLYEILTQQTGCIPSGLVWYS